MTKMKLLALSTSVVVLFTVAITWPVLARRSVNTEDASLPGLVATLDQGVNYSLAKSVRPTGLFCT